MGGFLLTFPWAPLCRLGQACLFRRFPVLLGWASYRPFTYIHESPSRASIDGPISNQGCIGVRSFTTVAFMERVLAGLENSQANNSPTSITA